MLYTSDFTEVLMVLLGIEVTDAPSVTTYYKCRQIIDYIMLVLDISDGLICDP